MTELTIQILDELVSRLEPFNERLPLLLEKLLEVTEIEGLNFPKEAISPELSTAAYSEVLTFLINCPTPQEIIAFKVSYATQKRLQTLLTKNKEGKLIPQEIGELDVCEQLEHLMILLKAYAIKNIS